MRTLLFSLFLLLTLNACSQYGGVPRVYSNLIMSDGGDVYLVHEKSKIKEDKASPQVSYSKLSITPAGNERGISFNFKDSTFNGTIYYGLIPTEGIKFPQPIYFKRNAKIIKGRADINIQKSFKGKYDFIGWEESGKIRMGYRVLNENGVMLYNGRINVLGKGPFEVDNAIIEGPFINRVHPDRITISFKTAEKVKAEVFVNNQMYFDQNETRDHEILIHGLESNTQYDYTINYGKWSEKYHFTTAPMKGSREKFTFAYTSDSREGQGGGERAVYGTNAYMMKKMTMLAMQKNAAFMQFTGDMVNGYLSSQDAIQLQYTNWKNAVDLMWRYIPIYVGMGNHEALMRKFGDKGEFDSFPFATESAEATFNMNFTCPLNGPESEDGAYYDPDPKNMDFPPYKENVYYFTYANMAMVVLNSNYWYAPNKNSIPYHSGNLRGYLMEQQLKWFAQTMQQLEEDADIDHIFVTLHVPAFPNGGHSHDAMWFSGDNKYRTWVAGKPLEFGIIENRDQFLDIAINQNTKCIAILAGDEHNYNRLLLTEKTPIYPEGWDKERLKIGRDFWQITNGAAGAPYYAQEELPWSDDVQIFSALNALMLVHIEGEQVELEVINPDTFEEIEKVYLRK